MNSKKKMSLQEHKGSRFLITGASGHIGSNLLDSFDCKIHNVTAITRNEKRLSKKFGGKIVRQSFHNLNWDTIGNIDVLFHEAAITNTLSKNEEEMFLVNTKYSLKLFEEAIVNKCKIIVYASSTAVYGNSEPPFVEGKNENPLNPYGKSKLALDIGAMELAKKYPHVRIVGLRFCSVFGPGENTKEKNASMVYQLAKQVQKGKVVLFKTGIQKREFLYVDDAIRANHCALNAKESCVVNCATGKPVSFNNIVSLLKKILKKEAQVSYIEVVNPTSFQKHIECDISAARKKIGFMAKFNFEEALVDYYKTGELTN